MTLSTIQNRVLNKLGDTIVNGVFGYTAAMIKDDVNMGIRVIVSRTPNTKCKQVYHTKPSSKFAPDDGLVLETVKLLSVTRDDSDDIARKSDEIPYGNIQETEVNSLYAPSVGYPKHIITPQSDGTVKVRVYPASASNIAQITYVSYPEVNPAFATVIAGFPEELEPFVDLYAVIQGKIRAMGYYRKLINDQVNLINGTFVVSTNTFTTETELNYNHNNGAQPDVLIIDSNGNEIQADVDHTDSGGTPSVNDVRIRFTFSTSGTVILSGYSTSSGLLDNFISTLPTWTSPTSPVLPILSTIGDLASLTNAIPTYANINLSNAVAPILSSKLNVGFPSISGAIISNINTARTIVALNKALDLIDTDSDAAFANDDFEKMGEAVRAASTMVADGKAELDIEIAQVRADTESIIGEFNGDIQAYSSRLNGAINEYKSEIDNYISDIKKFIDQYVAESGSDVSKFTAEFQYLASKYREEANADISEYRAKVEAVLGEYAALVNETVAEFQAAITKARAYLEAATIRLRTSDNYVAGLGALPNEVTLLQKQFDEGIDRFIRN